MPYPIGNRQLVNKLMGTEVKIEDVVALETILRIGLQRMNLPHLCRRERTQVRLEQVRLYRARSSAATFLLALNGLPFHATSNRQAFGLLCSQVFMIQLIG